MAAIGAQGAAGASRKAPPFQVCGNAAHRKPAAPHRNRPLSQQRGQLAQNDSQPRRRSPQRLSSLRTAEVTYISDESCHRLICPVDNFLLEIGGGDGGGGRISRNEFWK